MAKKESECKVTVVAPPDVKLVETLCVGAYFDVKLGRNVYYGERLPMSETRADELAEKGLVIKL